MSHILKTKSMRFFNLWKTLRKKLFVLNISSEDLYGQYDKTWLERLLLEDFISRCWIDWMDIITKVEKFKVIHQY